ncbi:hypothetical protein PIB30_115767, partial [Stylosanthes scabra]|nr:hypothetical protein [Stylosanthes scabra]
VDQRYVLERWSKKVKRNHTNISSSYNEPVLDETTQRYNGALSRCFEACQVGSKSEGRERLCIAVWTEFSASCNNMKKKRKSR